MGGGSEAGPGAVSKSGGPRAAAGQETGANAAAPVVAIDGPSGAGKGTVARLLARRCGWHLLDSGALYRLVALAGGRQGLAADDAEGHAALAADLPARFETDARGSERILLDGTDVTVEVRSETAGAGASRVAVWPQVRTALLERQRAFARPPGLVADGRDMGTVVFVHAPLKIFLTASAEERARRRYNQLKEKDSGVSLPALSREIAERDRRDERRQVAPLRPAADAIVLDSTALDAAGVAEAIFALGRRRALWE